MEAIYPLSLPSPGTLGTSPLRSKAPSNSNNIQRLGVTIKCKSDYGIHLVALVYKDLNYSASSTLSLTLIALSSLTFCSLHTPSQFLTFKPWHSQLSLPGACLPQPFHNLLLLITQVSSHRLPPQHPNKIPCISF